VRSRSGGNAQGRSPWAALVAGLATLALAGCGLGAGEGPGEVELRVTRDHGAEELIATERTEARGADTVLRILDRSAEVSTRYGGRFVQGVEGLEGGIRDGRLYDWFYSVNGVEPGRGSTEYELGEGDRVWWDYRDWSTAMRIPANVGAFPEPFLHGYGGERHPVVLRCLGAAGCGTAERALREAGVRFGTKPVDGAIRILAGPWQLVRHDPVAALIERGPASSGVFAEFRRRAGAWRLALLDERGAVTRTAGRGAALVAALRRGEEPPVWVVTGIGRTGVAAAGQLLQHETLAGKYAAGPHGEALPVR
jgi:hypothetical protein